MEPLTQLPNCKRKLDWLTNGRRVGERGITIFYNTISCRLVELYQCFRIMSRLCLQGWKCCRLAHERSCQVIRAHSPSKCCLIDCDTMSAGRWFLKLQRHLLCTFSSIHFILLHMTFNSRGTLKDKCTEKLKEYIQNVNSGIIHENTYTENSEITQQHIQNESS
jgi:hypothetical protein